MRDARRYKNAIRTSCEEEERGRSREGCAVQKSRPERQARDPGYYRVPQYSDFALSLFRSFALRSFAISQFRSFAGVLRLSRRTQHHRRHRTTTTAPLARPRTVHVTVSMDKFDAAELAAGLDPAKAIGLYREVISGGSLLALAYLARSLARSLTLMLAYQRASMPVSRSR